MNNVPQTYPVTRWVRSKNGMVAGVCEGLARHFAIEAWILRVVLVVGTLCLFTGPLLYLMLAISLPREDRIAEAYEGFVLGVCSRVSRRSDIEIGLVRFGTILFTLFSGGFAILVYVVLYFFMPDPDQTSPNVRS
jgi:phage shock protein C